jgi:uncharacterized protein
MQPINVALVQLFKVDQTLRDAQGRLATVTHEVRQQESRVASLDQQLKNLLHRQKEAQAHAATIDLELKSREQHIEKLRDRQNVANNPKEYQALLLEIGAGKVDKAKIEEQGFKTMELVENLSREVVTLQGVLTTEQSKLSTLQAGVTAQVAEAEAEIASLRPQRDKAAEAVNALSATAVPMFDRVALAHDGEAMAPLFRPNESLDEFACFACQMDLTLDTFNRLRVKNEPVVCPSCRRLLFIDASMSMEAKKKVVATRPKVTRKPKAAKAGSTVPESKWHPILEKAQAESRTYASEAQADPVDCRVAINGEVVGTYKAKSAENLQRIISVLLEDQKMKADVAVEQVTGDVPADAGQAQPA